MTAALSSETTEGTLAPGFEAVRDVFTSRVTADGGGAFSAVVDGRTAVDLWGGPADVDGHRPWRARTPAVVFSGTKGLVATVLMLLVDRGLLDLDASVDRIWPAFAASGKAGLTVADVASHTAGLEAVDAPLTREDLAAPQLVAARLAEQAPSSTRGGPSYHALTWGWLVGELVRRVSGWSVGRVLHGEIARPFGLDLRLGAQAGAPLEPPAQLRPRPGFRIGRVGEAGTDPRLAKVYENPPLGGAEAWNNPALLALEVPAANAVATAPAMATLYGLLAVGGTTQDGRRLIGSGTVDVGRAPASEGVDPLSGRPLRFSAVGFELAGTPSALGPPADAFGHTGAGGSSHGAWPSLRTGFSFVTPVLRREDDDGRAAALLDALHDALVAGGAEPAGAGEDDA